MTGRVHRPVCFQGVSRMTLKATDHRRHEDRDARPRNRAPVDHPPAARGDQAEGSRRAHRAFGRGRASRIIDKMIKQRRESIAQFDAGGRPELVCRRAGRDRRAAGLHAAAALGRRDRSLIDAAIAGAGAVGPAAHGQGDGRSQAPTGRPRRHDAGLCAGEDATGGLNGRSAVGRVRDAEDPRL